MNKSNEVLSQDWFTKPQEILQAAYNLDNKIPSSLSEQQIFETLTVSRPLLMLIHRAFYDGAFSSIPEIRIHMDENPDGVFVGVLKKVRDARAQNDDYYTVALLNEMYGLRS